MYLALYHGRDTATEEVDGTGYDGPTFGPLERVTTTYGNYVRAFFTDHAAATACKVMDLDPEDDPILWLDIHTDEHGDSLLEYQGKYYGDWAVSLTVD